MRLGDVDLAAEAIAQPSLAIEDGADEQGVDEGRAVATVVGDLDGEVAVFPEGGADGIDAVGLSVRSLEKAAVSPDDLLDAVAREVEESPVW